MLIYSKKKNFRNFLPVFSISGWFSGWNLWNLLKFSKNLVLKCFSQYYATKKNGSPKDLLTSLFFDKVCEISKNTVFTEHV